MQISLSPVGGYPVFVGIIAVLAAIVLLIRPASSVSKGRRRILFALRLAILLVLTFVMLRPTIVHKQITKQSATLVLLVDRSRSMAVADMVAQQSRWSALVDSFEDALPDLKSLGKDLEVKVYAFDAEEESLDFNSAGFQLPKEPDGKATAIGAALEDVLRREAGKRLVGVIVMSDGAQRAYAPRDIAPQTPARRLADLGYPLFAVPFGKSGIGGQTQDISLAEMLAPPNVFVKNSLEVTGTAQVSGFVQKSVPVQLLFETRPGEMKPVAATTLAPTLDGQRMSVALEYTPKTPGEYKITLKALAPEGTTELVTANNELSTFVTVLKGGLKVLYLEGELRPEQKFLRRALDASPDINVDYIRIDPRHPETRPSDLIEQFMPGKFDVYILGDLDSSALKTEEMTALGEAIEAGAGFIMLGGIHTFGAGGYGQTPLAAVSPIQMNRLERQQLDEPIRPDLHRAGDILIKPTKLGETQRLMLLGSPEKNASIWQALPPLRGANRFEKNSLKGNVGVLAETPDGLPLIVAKDYGRGRTLAFAGDSTWRWAMAGKIAEHRRFWRQIVLWLARKDEATEGYVWIKLAEHRFAPNSRVEWTVGADDPQGAPLMDVQFEINVILPNTKTKQPARQRTQGEDTIGSFVQTEAAGDYTIEVVAKKGSETLGEARARFLVYDQDLELNNPAADPTMLSSLAAMTGGKTVPPEKLGDLLDEIRKSADALDIETLVKRELWDGWWPFVVFVCLMAVEWFLRKKWGLV